MTVVSGAKCDICGSTHFYDTHYGKVNTKSFLRKEGWSFGKVDRCPNCSGKKARD